jgi:DNA/RNA-binding domain of Phe-tRNA-synthetase-like protein
MIYQVDPALFEKYPGYRRGVIVARRIINIESPIDEVARMLRSAEKTIRSRTDLDPLAQHLNIASWRAAYRAFGARPTDYPSSIEAIVKRVKRGDELPYINTLAALCNSVSLRYLVPIGGHAIDVLPAEGEIRLGFAQGDESFTPLGSAEIEQPLPGEVIFASGSTVLCRRWTWRQAEFTKLERTTSAVVINIDGLPPVNQSDVETISADLARLVAMYTDATAEEKILSQETPVIEV